MQSKALDRLINSPLKTLPSSIIFFPFFSHSYQAILWNITLAKSAASSPEDLLRLPFIAKRCAGDEVGENRTDT